MEKKVKPKEYYETLELWLRRYHRSESYTSDFFNLGRKNYRLYKSYKEGKTKAYKHSIFVPYSFAYMEDMTAYFMLSILASPLLYSLTPWYKNISQELCAELEKIVQLVLLDERTEFVLEMEELIKSIGIYNVAYLINYPLLKEIKKYSPDGSPLIDETGQPIVSMDFDYLYLDTPNPLMIYPEPSVKRLSRANWIIKKSYESLDYLKQLEKEGVYSNINEIGDAGNMDNDIVAELLSEIGISSYDYDPNKIEILDCFEDRDVVTIANRQVVIRDTTKDFIRPYSFKFPILDTRLGGAPREFYGIGMIESIKPTQEELNILRSQRRDNVSMILNKLFLLDMTAGEVDFSTLFSAPGNVIVTEGGRNVLDELPVSDLTSSSYKEEESLIYDLQNITSMWNYARGGTPRRRETATGIIRLQQAAQARNEWYLRKIDTYILAPLCIRVLTYLREYLDREIFDLVIGPENHANEFFSLDPEHIQKGLIIRPLTESIVSVKEVDVNNFLQAFDRLISLPEVNRPALIKQLLFKLGNKDIKEILPMLSKAGQAGLIQGAREIQQGMPMPGQQANMPMPPNYKERMNV